MAESQAGIRPPVPEWRSRRKPAGQFNITAVADRDTYPDLEVFAAGVREELHALERRLHRAEVVA